MSKTSSPSNVAMSASAASGDDRRQVVPGTNAGDAPKELTVSINFYANKQQGERVMRHLLGDEPATFAGLDQAGVDAREVLRRNEMLALGRAPIREGRSDTGVSVFVSRFRNGVKTVSFEGLLRGLAVHEYQPARVYLFERAGKDGQPPSYFLKIGYVAGPSPFKAGTCLAINAYLRGVWGTATLWDNRGTITNTVTLNIINRLNNADAEYDLVLRQDWGFELHPLF